MQPGIQIERLAVTLSQVGQTFLQAASHRCIIAHLMITSHAASRLKEHGAIVGGIAVPLRSSHVYALLPRGFSMFIIESALWLRVTHSLFPRFETNETLLITTTGSRKSPHWRRLTAAVPRARCRAHRCLALEWGTRARALTAPGLARNMQHLHDASTGVVRPPRDLSVRYVSSAAVDGCES